MVDFRLKAATLNSNQSDELKNQLKSVAEGGANCVRFAPTLDNADFLPSLRVECQAQKLELVIDFSAILSQSLTEDSAETGFIAAKLAKVVADLARPAKNVEYYILSDQLVATAQKYATTADGLIDEAQFVKATVNLARTVILAGHALRHLFLVGDWLTEPTYLYLEKPTRAVARPGDNQESACRLSNSRRFLALDLILGQKNEKIRHYASRYGLTDADYQWFMSSTRGERAQLGLIFNPKVVSRQKSVDLALEYGERYRLPLWLMRTASADTGAAFESMATRLTREGLPVIGVG